MLKKRAEKKTAKGTRAKEKRAKGKNKAPATGLNVNSTFRF